MKDNLNTLIRILKKAGHEDEAEKVESLKIKIDPLSAAVSMGLLNPNVLSVFEEEGHEEDLDDFRELLDSLKKDVSPSSE